MILERSHSLPMLLEELSASGRLTFTRNEAIERLQTTRDVFLKATARLQKQGRLFSPRHGFYVIVPSQHKTWGAPPPAWYIDALMKHEERPYYVALLKAAEIHGASHQAVMEFQVITDKQLPKIKAGRSIVAFYYKKNTEAVSEGIERHKTETGYMNISCAELTALDLFRYPHAASGANHIATVLADLGKNLDPNRLSFLATAFERPVIQRLGYTLDYLGYDEAARHLMRILTNTKGMVWTELENPPRNVDQDLITPPIERDKRWHIVVRNKLEVDE